jgi:hypothetical protein
LADATATLRPPLFRRHSGLRRLNSGTTFGVGLATLWLSLLVFIPLGAVVWRAREEGVASFWDAATAPEAAAAIRLTVASALIVAAINAVLGTLIAWVLVRDDFHGKRIFDALIDLPFALPTIVAGLVLLTLYGVNSPVGVHLAYTRAGVSSRCCITLPFVVRTVQPVLLGSMWRWAGGDVARRAGSPPSAGSCYPTGAARRHSIGVRSRSASSTTVLISTTCRSRRRSRASTSSGRSSRQHGWCSRGGASVARDAMIVCSGSICCNVGRRCVVPVRQQEVST